MCDCIAKLDKALEEHNTMFEKIIYFKHPSMEMVSTIQIAVKKINPRGKKPIHLFLRYCPFCGEEWEKEEDKG